MADNYPRLQDYQGPKKSNNKLLWIFLALFIVLVLIWVFIFLNSSKSQAFNIPDNSFVSGSTLSLKEKDNINFNFEGVSHNININSVNSNYVSLTIYSNPISLTLTIGIPKQIDINGDSVPDIELTLNSIDGNKAIISIKKIEVCNENWACEGWTECLNAFQTRTCEDLNNCGTIENKPATGQVCVAEQNQNETGVNETLSLIACNDWDCFINASKTCHPSTFTNTSSAELFNIISTATISYKVNKSSQGGICTFELKREEVHVNFAEEYLNSTNLTQEEINAALETANNAADMTEGQEGTCTVDSDDLGIYLGKLKSGNLSGGVSCTFTSTGSPTCDYSGDWELLNNCEGTYFTGGVVHDNPDCKIQFPSTVTDLLKGVNFTGLWVYGYENENSISWSSSNESVATIVPTTGVPATIVSKEVGLTNITATDTSIGSDCKVSYELEVQSIY